MNSIQGTTTLKLKTLIIVTKHDTYFVRLLELS